MNAEPAALATLQPLAPPPLDRVVRKCLAKDPDERWDSAHDAADELRWIRRTSAEQDEAQQVRRRWSRRIGLAAAVVVVAAIVAGAVLWRPQPAPAPLGPVVRLNLALPADVQFSTAVAPAWSPDGRRIIFGGLLGKVQQLYLRRAGSVRGHGAHRDRADRRALLLLTGRASCRLLLDGQSAAEADAGGRSGGPPGAQR